MRLNDNLVETFRILPTQIKALKRLRIETVGDLLFHFPTRYGDMAEVVSISNLKKGDTAVVFGKISGLNPLGKESPWPKG